MYARACSRADQACSKCTRGEEDPTQLIPSVPWVPVHGAMPEAARLLESNAGAILAEWNAAVAMAQRNPHYGSWFQLEKDDLAVEVNSVTKRWAPAMISSLGPRTRTHS